MSFEVFGKRKKYSVRLLRANSNQSFEVELNKRHRQVTLLRTLPDNSIDILVGHKAYHVKLIRSSKDDVALLVDGRKVIFTNENAQMGRGLGQQRAATGLEAGTVAKVERNSVVSSIPGRVIRVLVEPGMRVKKGDVVAVVESMKMEASIRSHREGTVREVKTKEGEGIHPGSIIALLD
jgi:biotin carboxyl carrier protein